MAVTPKKTMSVLKRSFRSEWVDKAEKLIDAQMLDQELNWENYHANISSSPSGSLTVDRYWSFHVDGYPSVDEANALEARYRCAGWTHVRLSRDQSSGSEQTGGITLYLYEAYKLAI
ncbi:MAG TPA: hypothetical protein VN843_01565 [Anaerolineales bacterium]|nr:hypothetical protein [Anaerolineales bacterium]